jgi:hypothetical protein
MLKRDEGRARSNPGVGPAPRAFMQLSADGAAELEETSPRRKAAAILLSFLVLLAVPFYLAAIAHGSGGDQPLAVKSSGPGSGDDEDDDNSGSGGNSGPGSGDDDDDTPTGTTPNTGPSNTATNDTATGTNTAAESDDGVSTDQATATGTTQGTGPSNTNTNNTATGTKTKNDD